MKLNTLLDRHGLSRDDCDLIVIGDGSGGAGSTQGVPRPAAIGWAAVLYDLLERRWQTLCGCQTTGTIEGAELYGAWQILRWHNKVLRPSHQLYRVQVFSDNLSTVGLGNDVYIPHGSNHDLWAGFRTFCKDSYEVRWHFIDKTLPFPLHALVDQLSASAKDYALLMQPEYLPDVTAMLEV